MPSDAEVQERKLERMVTRLAAEGQGLPLEDFAELGPVARRVAEHEHRDRIVALLLRRFFAPAVEPEEPEETPSAPPPRREGGYRRRR